MRQILSFPAAIFVASTLALGQLSPFSSRGPAVTVVKVADEEVRPTTTFTGRIEAKDKIDLRARVDGFLEKRLFTEGADVKEGDLLFVIEKGLYEAAVEQAKGGVAKAEAALKLADLEVQRQQELVTRNVARRSSEIDAKPCRYQLRPTGPTNKTSSVMYVTTIATEVLRDSAEHKRPIVVVARQVVAMMRKNANSIAAAASRPIVCCESHPVSFPFTMA